MKITKKNIILLLALMLTTLAHAQASIGEKAKKDLIQKTSFGGYVIGKATITDQDYFKAWEQPSLQNSCQT